MLSGSTILKSKEFIGQSLDKNSKKMIEGVLYYKTRDKEMSGADEMNIIKSLSFQAPQPDYIRKLSIKLDIETKQAYDVFVAFMSSEFSGSANSLKDCFSCDKNLQQLSQDLEVYYFEERLFALFCLKEILSNLEASSHPYKKIFSEYINDALQSDKFKLIESIIEQLKYLLNRYPDFEGGFILEEPEAKTLQHEIRERFELLQILMLIFRRVTPKTSHILDLMTIFGEFSYRNIFQKYRGLFKQESEEILDMLPVMESLLIVQSMDVRSLYNHTQSALSIHHLLENSEQLLELDKQIRSLGATDTNCILYLGWLIVRSFDLDALDSVREGPEVIMKLGSAFLEVDTFAFLTTFIQSNFFDKYLASSKVGGAIKATIGSLLDVLFTVYEFEAIFGAKKPSALQLISSVLDEPTVASEVFSGDPDEGILSIVKNTMTFMTRDLQTMLRMVIPAVTTPSFIQVFDMIREIDSFVETIPNSANILGINNDGQTYYSLDDREVKLSSSVKLSIPVGSTARFIKFDKDTRVVDVEWTHGLKINGWYFLKDVVQARIQTVSSGVYSRTGDPCQNLQELELINELASKMIKSFTDPEEGRRNLPQEIQEIVRQAIDALKLFTRFTRIPRVYVASILDLFNSLALYSRKEAATIWKLIKSVTLFPVLLNSGSKPNSILEGHAINVSTIGTTICQFESPSGPFPLCIAFLELLDTMIEMIPMDDVMTASVFFVISELFPICGFWLKKRQEDAKVVHLCYSVANKVMSVINRTTPEGQMVTKFTRVALFSGNAGEALLKTVRQGRDLVFKTICYTGIEAGLVHDDVFVVRLSLTILHQLLMYKEFEKKHGLPETKATVVEEALFNHTQSAMYQTHFSSFVNQPDNKNMLLILCNYVFQTYDFRLVVQGLRVLKRLAKSFPMSMLACLGSAAEAVKEHFLARLQSTTEDIRIKESLLDFLSACVQYQPGLMELFININASTASPGDPSNSVLQTVLDILIEKKEGKVFCPEELHVASVKFLSTFWLRSNHLTIECLKKCPSLWDLICFPLKSDAPLMIENQTQNQLYSNIIKLVSRELVMTVVEKRSALELSLEKKVEDLIQTRLEAMSSYISKICSSVKLNNHDYLFQLMSSWRDLVVTLARTPEGYFDIRHDLRTSLYRDILQSLLQQMIFGAPLEVLLAISETSVVMLDRWSEAIVTVNLFDEWMKLWTRIVYQTTEAKENLSFSLLMNFEVMFMSYIRATQKLSRESAKELTFSLVNWIPAISSLLLHVTRVVETKNSLIPEKDSQQKLNNVHRTLLCLSLTTFNRLITTTKHFTQSWLPALKQVALIETLAEVLLSMIQSRREPELINNLIVMFLTFSEVQSVAEIMVLSSPANLDWVSAVFKMEGNGTKEYSDWSDTFLLTIRFLKLMIITRGSLFVPQALNIVTQNLDRLTTPLKQFRNKPNKIALSESKAILSLGQLLSKYRLYWQTKFQLSFEVFIHESSITSYATIGYIRKPSLFQLFLDNSSSTNWMKQSVETPSFVLSKEVVRHRPTFNFDSPTKVTPPSGDMTLRDTDVKAAPKKRVSFAPESTHPVRQETVSSSTPSRTAIPTFSVDTGVGTKAIVVETVDAETEGRLHHILSSCLHILTNCLPSLTESIRAKRRMDKDMSTEDLLKLHLETVFTTPLLEKKTASFGSLLKTIEIYCTILADKTTSPGKHPEVLRALLESSLDAAVTLIFSQACIAHIDSNLTAEDRRELRTKLRSDLPYNMSSLLRSSSKRRTSISKTPPERRQSVSTTFGPDVSPLVKFICQDLMESVFPENLSDHVKSLLSRNASK